MKIFFFVNQAFCETFAQFVMNKGMRNTFTTISQQSLGSKALNSR